MWSKKQPKSRPLGLNKYDNPQNYRKEKTMFRENLQIMSNILVSPKPSLPTFHTYLNHRESGQWAIEGRRQERDQINNASKAVYHNKIRERVMSANGDRSDTLRFQRPICARHNGTAASRVHVKDYQCEVLGPSFCTDCIQLKRRIRSAETQRSNFPGVEVHPRALVAPNKLEQLAMEMSNSSKAQNKQHSGNSMDYIDNLDIHCQTVYTQNDIYSRLRQLHKEKGNSVFGQSSKSIPKSAGLIPESLFVRQKPESTVIIYNRPKITFTLPSPDHDV